MLQLPNGCSCSNPTISPANWDKKGASIKRPWYVQYWFHDPVFKEKYPQKYKRGKFVLVKGGINSFHTIEERRVAAKIVLNATISNLLDLGFNPHTGEVNVKPNDPQGIADEATDEEITPDTPFIRALRLVYNRFANPEESEVENSQEEQARYVKNTMDNIRYIINHVEAAAAELNYSKLPIGTIRKKHIRVTFERVGKIKGNWTANQFNHYRSHLGMVFSELEELEAIDSNYCLAMKKKLGIQKLRRTLTVEERQKINKLLHDKYYEFWRYVHIFFHSGSRTTELLRIKGNDVSLQKQTVKLLVKKGQQYKEVIRSIKDIAMPFWVEIMARCGKEDYVFSEGLIPGKTTINPKQISKRWRAHVKDKKTGLGIDVDFYKLKHLNTTEVINYLTERMMLISDAEKQAADMNGHTTTQMVKGIYDTENEAREGKSYVAVRNAFA